MLFLVSYWPLSPLLLIRNMQESFLDGRGSEPITSWQLETFMWQFILIYRRYSRSLHRACNKSRYITYIRCIAQPKLSQIRPLWKINDIVGICNTAWKIKRSQILSRECLCVSTLCYHCYGSFQEKNKFAKVLVEDILLVWLQLYL